MLLYKYLSSDLIKVLVDQRIRFSQPAALNDPFESLPFFRAAASPVGLARALAETVRQLPAQNWEEMRKRVGTDLDQRSFADAVQNDSEVANTLHEGSHDSLIVEGRDRLYRELNLRVGILSLSEAFDELSMWAHYADNHAGYVIEFDTSDQFFRTSDPIAPFAEPQKMNYSARRPETTFEAMDEQHLFLNKSLDWSREREWRFMKHLASADVQLGDKRLPVCLFAFPRDCVRRVFLGCRASSELREEVRRVLTGAGFERASMWQARMDTRDYALKFTEAS